MRCNSFLDLVSQSPNGSISRTTRTCLFLQIPLKTGKILGLDPNIRMNLILGILSNSSKPSLILIFQILDKNIIQNILPISLSALLYARVEGLGAQSKERKGSNFAAQGSGAIVQKAKGPNTYGLKIRL